MNHKPGHDRGAQYPELSTALFAYSTLNARANEIAGNY